MPTLPAMWWKTKISAVRPSSAPSCGAGAGTCGGASGGICAAWWDWDDLQLTNDDLQATNDGLQPTKDGLQPTVMNTLEVVRRYSLSSH